MQNKKLFRRRYSGSGRNLARTLALALALVLTAGLAGCQGKPKPPAVAVAAYLETLKTLDTEAGNAYLYQPTVVGDLLLNGRATVLPSKDAGLYTRFQESMRAIFGTMTFRIKSTAISGTEAVVSAEITLPDLTGLENTLETASMSSSGTPAEQDLLATKTLVDELTAAASGKAARVVHTVRLDVRQIDGVWKILDHTIIGRAVIGNIYWLIIPAA